MKITEETEKQEETETLKVSECKINGYGSKYLNNGMYLLKFKYFLTLENDHRLPNQLPTGLPLKGFNICFSYSRS